MVTAESWYLGVNFAGGSLLIPESNQVDAGQLSEASWFPEFSLAGAGALMVDEVCHVLVSFWKLSLQPVPLAHPTILC